MHLSFTRGDGRRHHITAALDQKVLGYFAMADYGPALPHDIAHLAVETLFDLPYGFWGLVAAGARFETVNQASAGTPRVRRTDPLVETHLAELTVAEGLVNLFSHQQVAHDEDDDAYVAAAGALCAQHGQPVPVAVSAEVVARARRTLASLNAQWQATPPGETLHLDFPLDADTP